MIWGEATEPDAPPLEDVLQEVAAESDGPPCGSSSGGWRGI